MTVPLTVTRLTARGRGAVAILKIDVTDPQAAESLDRHFCSASGRQPSTATTGQILYGHWDREDVVIVRTAEQTWEVHCHGGETAVSRITADLGGETSATVSSRDLDGALLAELLKCRTQRTAKYLLAQKQGVLREYCCRVIQSKEVDDALPLVERFLSWQSFTRHLTVPWQVAVVGRPNAGKSSLLNALVGYERAIVFDQPGTTRDRVEVDITLDGWPFCLIDTAGIREDAADGIEAIGVAAARASIEDCDACLLVVDASVGWSQDDAALLARIPSGRPVAVLWNKSDLSASHAPSAELSRLTVIPTSATLRSGIDDLLSWLPRILLPEVPSLNEPLPVLPKLTAAFEEYQSSPDLPRLQRFLTAAAATPAANEH